jgi:hypothetical protein
MKSINLKSLYILVILSTVLISSCTVLDHDLIDNRQTITKVILDKRQLNWDSTFTEFSSKDFNHRLYSNLDTFVIIKPIIDVKRVNNENYYSKPQMLNDSIPTFWLSENFDIEHLYELDWYTFIHNYLSYKLTYFKPHYLPLITSNDYETLEKEVKIMENLLDSISVKEYTMSEKLYEVLSKYNGQYYILSSIKERYYRGVNYYANRNNFIRIRVFIFNKKSKKILYYNRLYNSFNLNPYTNYTSFNTFNFYSKKIMHFFKISLKSKNNKNENN